MAIRLFGRLKECFLLSQKLFLNKDIFFQYRHDICQYIFFLRSSSKNYWYEHKKNLNSSSWNKEIHLNCWWLSICIRNSYDSRKSSVNDWAWWAKTEIKMCTVFTLLKSVYFFVFWYYSNLNFCSNLWVVIFFVRFIHHDKLSTTHAMCVWVCVVYTPLDLPFSP